MISMAFECSTAASSLAIFDGVELVARKDWRDDRRSGTGLLSVLPGFLEASNLALADMDRFICGRGPGMFSSLRVAMIAATCAALPDDTEVYALASGEGLAAQLLADRDGPVTIVGDARRNTWWFGTFSRRGDSFTCDKDWQVVVPGHLPAQVSGSTLIVSPDDERLRASSAWSDHAELRTLPWAEGSVSPSAEYVGRRALSRIEQGIASDPLTPIYLHPPVATPLPK